MINYDLARRRGLSPETIVEIEKLQEYRELLGKLYLDGGISAAHYREAWTVNEFNLQALWQFPLDANYHMFWRMAGCIRYTLMIALYMEVSYDRYLHSSSSW